MMDSKKRLVALVALAGLAVGGCDLSQKDPNFPESTQPESFTATFNLATGAVPWPTDLFFLGSTDGTLNIPAPLNNVPFTAFGSALNALDGWSTTAITSTGFSAPIDPSTLSGDTVHVVELYLSNSTKAPASAAELPPGVPSPVSRVLVAGKDYSVGLSPAIDTTGNVLQIKPLLPLKPSHGLVNMGYLVLLTQGIKDMQGHEAVSDTAYDAFKSASSCSSFTDPTQNGLCQVTKWQLAIAQAVGIAPSSVILSWSYSTESVDDTFNVLAQLVPAQPIGVVATGLTTHDANAALPGHANIYVGTTVIPYYLTKSATPSDTAVLTSYWTAAGPPPAGLDPTSRNLTRFNPVPNKTADLTIPVLVTVPNVNAAGGACSQPASGWPVVVVQHGLQGDRTQALAIADSFADACFITAAIDMPLHGITDTANPFYQATNERTFNVDLVNNVTGKAPGDGKIDPSGQHWINLTSALTGRDNWRQGQADLMVFTKSVANLDITGDGVPDIDPARVSYVGISLGGIMGSSFVQFAPNVRTATVSVPGGVITELANDSPAFGPSIRAGLAGNGIVPYSQLFYNFMRDYQTAIDSGDPINHIFGSQGTVPLHLQKVVGDAVVPNSSTDRLIAAGKLKKIGTLGPTAVGKGTGGYTVMTAGSHSSLFSPASSLAATVEMQTQAVKFAASAVQPGGPFVVITNTSVVQP